jgi:(E)-2-((N-methylformamido)methylene)succinate hydrolase
MSDKAFPMLRKKFGDTAYIDVGEGEVIVFIHGVGMNAEAWTPQIVEFSRTHRVIAIDMLGHGESGLSEVSVTLDTYVEQLSQLLQHLGISTASVIGHSMGGLVAIGFALAHSQRCLRLGVLNSVYQRSAERRAAVASRAHEMAKSGTVGNIEEPLQRWFGSKTERPAFAKDVASWLKSADPQGYAAAYQVFAKGDSAFVGKFEKLYMPSLFATGSEDGNSTPEMAETMAAAARGSVLIVPGARHMMNLTHVAEVNSALHQLLATEIKTFDTKDLRNAFGSFMTGVTVVTMREANGSLRGFTANSFSSVSLDPPLLLACLSKTASGYVPFSTASYFAVNILAESQQNVSAMFASKRPDKFAEIPFTQSEYGSPLITGSVASFECARHDVVDAGDHVILIGRVVSYAYSNLSPLGYARGGYFTLGLEQTAVNAASQSGRMEVGAILECEGKLLVHAGRDGSYDLPHVGRAGEAGSVSRLIAVLAAQKIEAKLGFLFAVYEDRTKHTQSIYYRGEAQVQNAQSVVLLDFENLQWDKFRDDATRAMLKRYCTERKQGRYSIYSGDHVSGDVRELGDGDEV